MNQPNPPLAIRSPGDPSLTFPFAQAPAGGTWQEVAPGVFWLRMPLPFALDHINLWVLRDGDGWTWWICGLNTDATRELWDQSFDSIASRACPSGASMVTHYHPDHFGLAGWLTQRFDVELWMTEAEFVTAQVVLRQLPGHASEAIAALFARHGLDEARPAGGARAQTLLPQSHQRAARAPSGACWTAMCSTSTGASWRVIVGYGHAPEHAALYCEETRRADLRRHGAAQDQHQRPVWPASPNGDPLELFLRSVAHYAELPAEPSCCPRTGCRSTGCERAQPPCAEHHRLRLD